MSGSIYQFLFRSGVYSPHILMNKEPLTRKDRDYFKHIGSNSLRALMTRGRISHGDPESTMTPAPEKRLKLSAVLLKMSDPLVS